MVTAECTSARSATTGSRTASNQPAPRPARRSRSSSARSTSCSSGLTAGWTICTRRVSTMRGSTARTRATASAGWARCSSCSTSRRCTACRPIPSTRREISERSGALQERRRHCSPPEWFSPSPGAEMTESRLSYYGKPIIKEPVWKTEIPKYFFTGGLAGASATLSAASRASGNEPLARPALYVAAAGGTISPYFLIKGLGRPLRFYNMMRVFKVTSPMSVGTWIVATEGTSTGIAAACELFGVLPRVRTAAQVVSGLLGPAMASYTGALVADSVVPAWHESRRELPLLFASSSAAAAGGLAAALTPVDAARPARRLGLLGGLAELGTQKVMERRMGELVAEPYKKGEGARYRKAAEAATVSGVGLMLLAGRTRTGAAAAGALLAAGSWGTRFSGDPPRQNPAAEPRDTPLPQRGRGAGPGRPPGPPKKGGGKRIS